MQLNALETTPGPQYLPKTKPEVIKEPEYTFGYRRGGGLKNQTSTPAAVGAAAPAVLAGQHRRDHAIKIKQQSELNL